MHYNKILNLEPRNQTRPRIPPYTHLVVRDLVPDVGHEEPELRLRDGPGPPLVQHAEGGADEVLVVVKGAHLEGHHVAELGELDHAGTVSVELKDRIVSFLVLSCMKGGGII